MADKNGDGIVYHCIADLICKKTCPEGLTKAFGA